MSWRNRMIPIHELVREHVDSMPNKVAIIYNDQKITYKELNCWSDRVAGYLSNCGLKKGDSVAIYMQNCPQFIISYLAIQKIGGIVGPCSPMFKEWELEYELNDLQAKVILTTDDLLPIVRKVVAKLELQIILTTNVDNLYTGNELEENEVNLTNIIHGEEISYTSVPIDMENDIGLIVYTSGSTGLPKGAMLTFQNAYYKSYMMAKVRKYKKEDVTLAVMPLCHIAGMLGMNTALLSGSTIVLFNRFSPQLILEAIEKYKITVMQTVVPMNVQMMNHPLFTEVDFSSLRMNGCTSFGIPLSEEIINKWENITKSPLFESAYGLSETHTADAVMGPDEIKFGTTGKPIPDTKIKIISTDTREEVANNEEGEIVIKSPGVFKGYKNKLKETDEAFWDGWLLTGDIGKLDEEGYLYFLGRKKELIKCSGYSVFPEEVESMLNKHPEVFESAVIGVDDRTRGQAVKAFIVLKDATKMIDKDEMISWCKEKMAAYKYPRHIEFLKELPKSGTGKIIRRRLIKEENLS
ncbi:AMP-binding protein [Cytobacillus kochii]|uniref:class I adenylate-forming enzyme family protein n=1 Tax=Cytobacillus kochii TaxID=859143 RepID=UPI001CD3767E|nr:AMP-binding protein [Cytobacillus kochii]MCA1026664.1 AMP-binding protein [Cytobacillus kochii]